MRRATPAERSPRPPGFCERALDALSSGARSILGRALTGQEIDQFEKYMKLLQKWQKSQRLIGATDSRWIVENLFLDSLLFLRVLPAQLGSLADVGSGAGVPGIPIKIVRPWLNVTLVESRERRVSFLLAAVRELSLEGVQVSRARVERVAQEQTGLFGAVVMRCAGDFDELLPSAAKLVTPGGMVVATGPPGRPQADLGEWMEVPGVRPGRTRQFLVRRI